MQDRIQEDSLGAKWRWMTSMGRSETPSVPHLLTKEDKIRPQGGEVRGWVMEAVIVRTGLGLRVI